MPENKADTRNQPASHATGWKMRAPTARLLDELTSLQGKATLPQREAGTTATDEKERRAVLHPRHNHSRPGGMLGPRLLWGGGASSQWRFLAAPAFVAISLILLAPIFGLRYAPVRAAPSAREIVFLTWADYIDPDVVRDFEHKFHAHIRFVYFETDDARDDLMVQSDGHGYDLVTVNSPQFHTYVKQGWLSPLGEEAIPNLRHISEHWKNAVQGAGGYGVPYFWGTTGIAYRADLVPDKLRSWKQIFEPQDAIKGKIVMVRNARDVIGMALKALGYSADSSDPAALQQAERLLLSQKPYVKSYSYVSLGEGSMLLSGQASVAMMYSGDALMLREHDPRVVYTVPAEGGEIWLDYLTVMASSPHKKLAKEFINFLNEPANAARVALFVHYATPNEAAEKLLPAEFLRDPVVYPSPEVLNRCEFYGDLPPRGVQIRNRIFARLLQ
jgi:spermidine/putrescine transport system substrate-binding protein